MEWGVPTDILIGGADALLPREAAEKFAATHSATLTVMENGEHWFHTQEQLRFLDRWLEKCRKSPRKRSEKNDSGLKYENKNKTNS